LTPCLRHDAAKGSDGRANSETSTNVEKYLATKPRWTNIGKIKTWALDAAFMLATLVHDVDHAWQLQKDKILRNNVRCLQKSFRTLC
jgi:hypothetical protein